MLQLLPFKDIFLCACARDYGEAFKEVGVTIILSTVPIWLGAFFLALETGFTEYPAHLMQNLRSGELYLYSTALLAPLYYFIFKDYSGVSRFPSAGIFMLLGVLIAIVSSGVFAFRASHQRLGLPMQLDEAVVFGSSAVVYVIAVLLVYMAHVSKNLVEGGAPGLQRSQTQDFAEEFRARRQEDR